MAQAPRGGPFIKEIKLNNQSQQDLTRPWAAGPANFEEGSKKTSSVSKICFRVRFCHVKFHYVAVAFQAHIEI